MKLELSASIELPGVSRNVRTSRSEPTSVLAQSDEGYARETVLVDRKGTPHVTLRNVGLGTIEGRVVDETTGEPLAGIECADNSSETRTDSSGAFRFERVPAGRDEVGCFGADLEARAVAMVSPGKIAHVELAVKKTARPPPVDGYVGLELEMQGGNVAVKKVVPAGPADRAGMQNGHVVTEVDNEEVDTLRGRCMRSRIEQLDRPSE